MAKAKANIQWAPGTRLSRMNKEDGQYEYEMQLLRDKKDPEIAPPPPQPFKQGDWLVSQDGLFETAGEVKYSSGSWGVDIRGHEHNAIMFQKVPYWFAEQYVKLLKELKIGGF